MVQSNSSSFFKIVTHPAITIAFAIVGLFAGITAIHRSSNEATDREMNAETNAEQIKQIQAAQNRLELQVGSVSTKVGELEKTVSGLNEQVNALTKPVSPVHSKSSKTRKIKSIQE